MSFARGHGASAGRAEDTEGRRGTRPMRSSQKRHFGVRGGLYHGIGDTGPQCSVKVRQPKMVKEETDSQAVLAHTGPDIRVLAIFGRFTGPPLLGPWPENRLRGALGLSLRRLACALPGQFLAPGSCVECPVCKDCAYGLLFHGMYPEGVPRLKRHGRLPRPYVLSWQASPEGDFVLRVTVVGDHLKTVPHLFSALMEVGRTGVGAQRDTFVVDRITAVLDPSGHPPQEAELRLGELESIELIPAINLTQITRALRATNKTTSVTITLVSPAILRDRGGRHPLSPGVFVARLLERISLLTHAYCPGRLLPPYETLRQAAEKLDFVAPPLTEVRLNRYSRRQRTSLSMQAVLGQAEYRGELDSLMPYLVLGQWLHVGKGTAFGLGRYRVSVS